MGRIGELDQFITFEEEQGGDDGYGGAGAQNWTTHAQVWARVRPVRGTEGDREGAVRATSTYMVEVWQDGLENLTEAMRIVWGSVTMNIREIRRPTERKLMMRIIAESGVTQ